MPTSRYHRPPRKLLFLLILCVSLQHVQATPRPAADLLTYDELVELYEVDNPSEQLQIKLQNLLTIPFVSNEAFAGGVRPLKPHDDTLGRHLRVAQWNIERGVEYEALESVFTDPSKFLSLVDQAKYPLDSPKRKMILEQAALLRQADIIVLNEVDWGIKRTGYRNVIADLASALKMNYAYGPEFI